jgi:predicted aspartyl protease/Flp pilus assembly protein TadD
MHITQRCVLGLSVAACVVAGSLRTHAAQEPFDAVATLHAGDDFMAQTRYDEALDAYRLARKAPDIFTRVRAGVGAVRSLLKVGRFADAKSEAAAVASADPRSAAALAVHGDALWASGQFLDAESRYAASLAIDPNDAGGLHGRGRSLAAQHHFTPALVDLERAVAADPLEAQYEFTLGTTYEQARRYADALGSLQRYLRLLPKASETETEKWARTEVELLSGFEKRKPFDIRSTGPIYTVPFKVVNGQIHVNGRINGNTDVDFVVDTGAEHTVIEPVVAQRANVQAAATVQSAGVGIVGWGLRSLKIARLDSLEVGTLKVDNVTCLIKSPTLGDLPSPEGEAFSPLDIGLSVRIDYFKKTLTMAEVLPAEKFETELPMRVQRLAMVQGVVAGTAAASFVLDTGGEVMVLSRSMSEQLGRDPEVRRVPLKVHGTSGWDPTAYMRPYVNLEFAKGVGLTQASVVVLNLGAPSSMLGIDLGGIVGHDFLSKYTVAIDLQRSVVGLEPIR